MDNVQFRLVQYHDVPAILHIYEPYVLETSITFEFTPPSLEEFLSRVRTISAEYPYLVCLDKGRIVGYAYAHRHMERAAYQWNAELSIYLEQGYHGRGIGRKLYSALIEILRLQNIRNVYGCVTSPNEKSERLHEALGFTKLGVFHNAGYKCGKWHDVSWYEKAISPYGLNPEPWISIQNVDKEKILEILKNL